MVACLVFGSVLARRALPYFCYFLLTHTYVERLSLFLDQVGNIFRKLVDLYLLLIYQTALVVARNALIFLDQLSTIE